MFLKTSSLGLTASLIGGAFILLTVGFVLDAPYRDQRGHLPASEPEKRAAAIAVRFMEEHGGAPSRPPTLVDMGGVWLVHWRPPEGWMGGGAELDIDARTGAVLSFQRFQ